ncbi:hypothetical protein B0A48_13141 [Cryoendolithus antarcticus]|uniref:Uncharacterized protein n=1 Tax=Cryoendolithus antarcticus TaxID=1507870 RepID=A0A1V8SNW1_9PEZI|nr:hypothetical protein B0A48_13141 [Cryoendolithus antarcticus]
MATVDDIPIASLNIHNDGPAKASAAHQVFAIVELTESILSQGLRAAQLFTLRRVNRHFDRVINDSLPLQQQMFLKLFPFETHSFTYKNNTAPGGGWVFVLQLNFLPDARSIKAIEKMTAARIDSSGVRSTKVANAPLKLSGELVIPIPGLLQRRKESSFSLRGDASIEGIVAAFTAEVARMMQEALEGGRQATL